MLIRTQYERFIYTLPTRYLSVRVSTLVLTPPGLDTARLTGYVTFGSDCVLCVHELLDFQPRPRLELCSTQLALSD